VDSYGIGTYFLPTYFNKLFPFLSTCEEGRKEGSVKQGGPIVKKPKHKGHESGIGKQRLLL